MNAILHRGPARPLFGDHADHLSRLLDVPVVDHDRGVAFGVILAWDGPPPSCPCLVAHDALVAASDKRGQARRFAAAGVPTPESHLAADVDEVRRVAASGGRWLVKWPTGSGAVGHRFVDEGFAPTPAWTPPFLVQRYVGDPADPSVYRLYVVEGVAFGFNERRYPAGSAEPWITFHRGARYQPCGDAPDEARRAAVDAARAVGLEVFCAVDLVRDDEGWKVLEVNGEGLTQFVYRPAALPDVARALDVALVGAFRAAAIRARAAAAGAP